MSQTPSLTEIASKISQAASTIETYLKTNSLPQPSFAPDAPNGLPYVPEILMAKMQLVELLSDLEILVTGPAEYLSMSCMQVRTLIYPLYPLVADMNCTNRPSTTTT